MGSSPGDYRFDVGVLLVHGIGQPARRQTLRSFGEPLCRWIERRLQHGPGQPWDLSISEPPTDGTDPAHCEVEFRSDDSVVSRFLLAESSWASDIMPPTFAKLANWGVQAIPWTLGSHYARRIKRAWERFQFLKDGSLVQQAGGVLAFLTELCTAVVTVLLAVPLLVAFSFVLSLMALLPVPWVGLLLRRLQSFISARIGDSYALVKQHLGGMSAIVGRVRHDAEWLAGQCRTVAVVGHSQGAAAAHFALRKELPQVGLLVTFGSGLRKLEELRLPEHRLRDSLFVLGSGMIFVACLAGLAWGAPWWVAVATSVPIVLLLVMAAPRLFVGVGDNKLKATYAPIRQRLRWVDYWATSDPVSNGPLFDEPGFVSYPVHNRHSTVTDHTTYWENVDHFVGCVASEIARLAPSAVADRVPLDEAALERLSGQRERRIQHFVNFRRVVALITLTVAYFQMLIWRTRVATLLEPWEARYSSIEAYAGPLTLAAGVVFLALQFLGVRWSWAAWNHSDLSASAQSGICNAGCAGRRIAYLGSTIVALAGVGLACMGLFGGASADVWALMASLVVALTIPSGVTLWLERRHATWLKRQRESEARAIQARSLPDYGLPGVKE